MVRAPSFIGCEWVQGEAEALQARKSGVLLIDFFTFGCINRMNNLRGMKRLYERYGGVLTVVGVHYGKFAYEKETSALTQAIERLGIRYPVANDATGKLAEQFALKAWPTMIVADQNGYIAAEFRGEGQSVAIELALRRLGLEPTEREVGAAVPTPAMRFPEALAVSGEKVFVANSGGGDVREYTKAGRLLRSFGRFARPSALACFDDHLYIADREAGTVCRIGLKDEVRTVLLEQLRSPSALLVDADTVTVAEAGAHRITVYDRRSLQLLYTYGNRFEAMRDGEGEAAQLAQPMGLARCDDGTLWFVDAESSALRFIEGRSVTTVIGEGLFTFGDSDTAPILLQHPQGVACGLAGDGCGGGRLFVSDTYNGKVKAYDPLSGRIVTLIDGLNEPTGIAKQGCRLYIAETGAHRIVTFDLSAMVLETFAL
jgi:hypothetical protein